MHDDHSVGGGIFNNVRHAPRKPNEWAEAPHGVVYTRPGFVAPSSESFYKAMEVAESSHLSPGRVAAIKGLSKSGLAAELRQLFTSFGSPWRGLGSGPELSIAQGRNRRDDNDPWNRHYYRHGIMPYGLTPGQAFDAIENTSSIFRGGAGMGFSPAMLAFAGLDVAVSASTAPPEDIIGRVSGSIAAEAAGVASWYVGGPIGAIGGGILGGAAGEVIGGPGGAVVGARVGAFAGKWIGKIGLGFVVDPFVRKIGSPIDRLVGRIQRRVNFGQGFQDNLPAYSMRQVGLRQLQGSLLNASQYLGREAQLLHQ